MSVTNINKNAATNGVGIENDAVSNGDWRRKTMEAAMNYQAEDGTPWACLIGAMQTHLPDQTSCLFNETRHRVLELLRETLTDFREIIPATYKSLNEDEFELLSGWWSGTFGERGDIYEISLSPTTYGDGNWVVCGPDAARVENLIRSVREESLKRMGRCRRHAHGGWREDKALEMEVNAGATWDDIVLPPALIAEIRGAIGTFFAQRELFRRLGFAWRRGILLVGPPGTGKTMICKAAARAFDNVAFLYVQDMMSHQQGRTGLSSVFHYARRAAPCILAFEDIDGLLEGQNRSQFLNEMDGFKNNDGLLIIASSNHPERIDEALLKRPSRFDRVYHIGLPEEAERAEYCRRLLAKSPLPLDNLDTESLARRVAAASNGFTPSFLKEALLSATLTAAQEGQSTLGPDFAGRVLEQVDALKKYLKKARDPHALAEMTAASAPEIGFRSR